MVFSTSCILINVRGALKLTLKRYIDVQEFLQERQMFSGIPNPGFKCSEFLSFSFVSAGIPRLNLKTSEFLH